ncbi:MAG: hypothetical protein WC211_03645 [Dehalococcoidia bacterium]
MEIRSRSYQTAQVNRLVHDPECVLDVHSKACYIRETDKHTVTEFYGVENIEGVEHIVTGIYATEQEVPANPEINVRAKLEAARQALLPKSDKARGPWTWGG